MGVGFKLSLQMIVMPIVLTSILCGLEAIGDIGNLKGLGKRVVLYYFSNFSRYYDWPFTGLHY
jgi:Na+/H+-dicarboxylate symporter